MKNKIIALSVIIFVFLGLGSFAYAFRFKFYEWQKERIVAKLPPAIGAGQLKPSANKPVAPTPPAISWPTTPPPPEITPPSQIVLPTQINLAVPFTPQAPYGVWDEFHNDACEETSVLMVARFWQNRPIASPSDVDQELQKIKDFEEKTFGFHLDTNAAETAKILSDYYKFKDVAVKYDFTLEDLKREVLQGYPVIVPVAGRELHNPFYKQPGPLYHMLVIKGVTADGKFITNDPGTKRGADFVYSQTVMYNALNDWDSANHGLSGRKALIVARPHT